MLATLPHPAHAEYLVWNPRRPNVLAVACGDNLIYIWDVVSGKQTRVLKGETNSGMLLAYHPGGELLASRGWDGVLRLWDTRTGRMVLSRPSFRSRTLAFDRTGHWLSMDATKDKVRILEFADADECRTLVAEPFHEDDRYGGLAIDPTGRRLVTTGRRVALWDLPTGAMLATLPVPGEVRQALFGVSGAVLTEFPALLQWPIAATADGTVTIGPPQVLHPQGTQEGLAITSDGRTIAAAVYDGGLVLDIQDPRNARRLRPHRDVRHIAVSPDGRWVVTGTHNSGEGMKLWDARTGRLVHDFPGYKNKDWGREVRSFSPDGRWLALNSRGWILFETTTWTPRRHVLVAVSRAWAFAPDSRTAIYDDNAGSLILVEFETGRELVRFEDPEQARINAVAFTPDGSQVVATLQDRPYLRIWDLRAIRRRLVKLGLDWDPPASFTIDSLASLPPIPKPFRVDPGKLDSWPKQGTETPEQIVTRTTSELEAHPDDAQAHHDRGHALARLKRFDEAIADFTSALKASPKDAHLLASRSFAEASLDRLGEALADCEAALRLKAHQPDREPLAQLFNNLAWKLVSDPAHLRHPARALELARRAVDLTPDQGIYHNTLGVALYRAGRHAEAVPALEHSLAAGKGETDAFDLFFLAMARQKLGQVLQARAAFDCAVRWRRDQPNLSPQWTAELNAFQAEAMALLDGPPPELPADAFAPEPPDQP